MEIQNIRVLAFWMDSLSQLQAKIDEDAGYHVEPNCIKHIVIEPDNDDHDFHVTAIIWTKKEIKATVPIEKDTMANIFGDDTRSHMYI